MNKVGIAMAALISTLVRCNTESVTSKGCVTNYYVNGSKESEGCYIDSLKTGVWKEYYPSGKINATVTYLKGVKNGKSISYFKNGNKESEVNYKDGQFFGSVKFYHSNGIVNTEEFDDDKGEQGEFKLFYESGKLSQTGQSHNGKMVGKWFEYYENGRTKLESYYDSLGHRDSIWSYYLPNGMILKTEKYKTGSLIHVDSIKAK